MRLTAQDAEAVFALQQAAYAPERGRDGDQRHLPQLDQSPDEVLADLSDPNMRSYGLRAPDGTLVAAVRAYVGSSTAQVGRLCVLPSQQGKGLATKLLSELENVVPEHIKEVRIFTDSDAATSHHFYEKLGYTENKHELMDAGFDIVELRKKVAAKPAS